MTVVLHETFDYSTWEEMSAAGWTLRQPAYVTTGERTLTRSDPRMIGLGDGALTLRIRPDAENPGRHLVGDVSTGILPGFKYGTIAARVAFGRPRGAHGAVWHQSGYGVDGAELDLVEWFGERRTRTDEVDSQRVQHTVHVGPLDADGKTRQFPRYTWTGLDEDASSAVPSFEGRGRFGLDRTWWHTAHTYAVDWSPAGYRFMVDDVDVGFTAVTPGGYSCPAASRPGALILSLVSKDGDERADLLDHIAAGGRYSDYDVRVSWVKVTAR